MAPIHFDDLVIGFFGILPFIFLAVLIYIFYIIYTKIAYPFYTNIAKPVYDELLKLYDTFIQDIIIDTIKSMVSTVKSIVDWIVTKGVSLYNSISNIL